MIDYRIIPLKSVGLAQLNCSWVGGVGTKQLLVHYLCPMTCFGLCYVYLVIKYLHL